MAYMSQEKKKKIAEKLKIALKGSGLKYTLGVHHYSTLVMNIKSGPVDFIQNHYQTMKDKPHAGMYRDNLGVTVEHMDINPYWYHEHFSGKTLDLMKKIISCLNDGNHDRSDVQSDYFDVGWYITVNVGKWDKPYQLVK